MFNGSIANEDGLMAPTPKRERRGEQRLQVTSGASSSDD